jgi:hypothetical protein
MKALIATCVISFLLFDAISTVAQVYPDDKLGNMSRSNPFIFLSDEKAKYGRHHFAPKHDKVKAYATDGTFVYLSRSAEIHAGDVYRGRFDKKDGIWISSHIIKVSPKRYLNRLRYVFFKRFRRYTSTG